MKTWNDPRYIFTLAAGVLLAGCASYPISKPLRLEARKDITYEVAVKDPNAYKGLPVIWGGYIVETENAQGYSEVIVLDTPVDSSGEPAAAEQSGGRFVARIPKFLDPAVYRKGRKVTVAGKVAGQETRPLGKIDYAYPVLDIQEMYMWPRERPYPYDPAFEFGFWYGPGFFYEGFEGREHEEHEHRR